MNRHFGRKYFEINDSIFLYIYEQDLEIEYIDNFNVDNMVSLTKKQLKSIYQLVFPDKKENDPGVEAL